MMNIQNWQYLYKYTEYGDIATTNMLYTPYLSPSGDMLCMSWDENSSYHTNSKLSSELVNYFFEREVKHLTLFQKYDWAPRIADINLSDKKIFIEFNRETLNHIVMSKTRKLDQECANWKEQIRKILKDIRDSEYYKLALYSHCFYLDSSGMIKTIDFYSCIGMKERYMDRSKLEGLIGVDSAYRFDAATTTDNKIDFKVFFEITMNTHLKKMWRSDLFSEIYTDYYV